MTSARSLSEGFPKISKQNIIAKIIQFLGFVLDFYNTVHLTPPPPPHRNPGM